MYTPSHFAQSSPEALVALIEAHPLGALTTMLDGRLEATRYQRMRTAIVGFRMPVLEVQGKWKLSQNRTEADRAGVASALEQLDGEDNRAIALAMRRSGAGA